MAPTKHYVIDGMTLEIPVHYDQQAQMYLEDYPDFIQDPVWTPSGYRVLFSGTDACDTGRQETPGDCPDCGSCRLFQRLCDTTWIGLCRHPHLQRK